MNGSAKWTALFTRIATLPNSPTAGQGIAPLFSHYYGPFLLVMSCFLPPFFSVLPRDVGLCRHHSVCGQQDWHNLVMDTLSIRDVAITNRKETSAQKRSGFGAPGLYQNQSESNITAGPVIGGQVTTTFQFLAGDCVDSGGGSTGTIVGAILCPRSCEEKKPSTSCWPFSCGCMKCLINS